jgi:hypothetical protein
MKNTFGKTKSAILNKFTDLYEKNNKKEIKEILSIINEDKDFKELYLFYEDIQNIDISYPGSAELYVENIQPLLIEKSKNASKTTKKLSKYLNDVVCENNELFDSLDVLSESTTLNNLDKQVIAKRKLIGHLSTKKEISESQNESYTSNEKLLMTFLSNDFNSYFTKTLSEEDKTKLKNILSLSNEEIQMKTKQLSEEILSSISNILEESTDDELKNKLNKVKTEITNTNPSKYNYYKLLELKNGLD